MSKLHEVLAVHTDIEKASVKILTEAMDTFVRKSNLFDGKLRTYEPYIEDGEKLNGERVPIAERVKQKVDYVLEFTNKAIDIMATRELTNTVAKADIITADGIVLAKDVPATVLLNLESKLSKERDLFNHIPTLPLDKIYKWDDYEVCYKTEPVVTERREKIQSFETVVPATDKHPAQVKEIIKNEKVGSWTLIEMSGRISTERKSKILASYDAMILAVKQARERANNTEVKTLKLGETIHAEIFKNI